MKIVKIPDKACLWHKNSTNIVGSIVIVRKCKKCGFTELSISDNLFEEHKDLIKGLL